MNIRKTLSLLTATVMLMCGSAHAQVVTILPFGGDSVHEQIRSAARDALSIFLSDHKVDVRGNPVKASDLDEDAADEAAKAVGATHYIRGRITRLGHRAIVQVSRYAVGQKPAEHTDRMTATTPSDLETVMERLANSLATGQRANANEEITTVSRGDQAPLRRKTANHYFGVSLGGVVLALDDTEFLPGLGFNWFFDNRDVLLSAGYQGFGLGNTNQGYFELALGGYMPLSQKSNTIYVGGGLALSGASVSSQAEALSGEVEDHNDVGLSFFASIGALIGRTSTVALRPEIGYSIGTYTLQNQVVHGPRFGITLGF